MSLYNVGRVSRTSDFEYVWLLEKFSTYYDTGRNSLYSIPVVLPAVELTSVFKLFYSSSTYYTEFCLETSTSLRKIEVCILNQSNEKLYTTFIEKSKTSTVKFIKTDILLNGTGLLNTNGDLRIRIEIEKVGNQNKSLNQLSIAESLYKYQALDQFEALLNNQEFSDVKFVVDGKTIYANKAMLISRSSVFLAMFKHKMREAKEDTVEIMDIEYNILLETLRFIYAGKVNEIEKFSKELLATADKYDLDGLKEMCTTHLCTNMSIENVVEYLNLADLHNVQPLREKAIQFIIDNGKTMVNRPEFHSIVHLHKNVFLEVVRTVLLLLDKNKNRNPHCTHCRCFG